MLRYGICSRKDTENRFLGVLDYMRGERLRLKALGKSGDKSASFQEKSLKVLINGSYGFFGTGYYSFNDYEAAALVTAYGRKILDLMVEVVESCGGITIEIDTDGIFFSHDDPETVSALVAEALPDGIEIELELKHCGLYAPKAKSYVLVSSEGKTSVKGLFRKRNRYPLQNEFPIEFIKLYFTQGIEASEVYYQEVRSMLASGDLPVEDLTITRKISTNEKNLVELGLGKPGDRVSYWYKKMDRYHAKTARPFKPMPVETNSGEYWSDYYLTELDEVYRSILGIEEPRPIANTQQMKLELTAA
jgi:DNA polymerase, archaea type